VGVSGISIRSQYSENPFAVSEAWSMAACVCLMPGGKEGRGLLDTKTTSNLRRWRSFPITT